MCILKKSSNFAVLGDLGRYPLYITIINTILKHLNRTKELDHDSLYQWKRSIIPTAHNSDSPLLRQPITPTAHYSDGPFFRQCKIELNPQIHGLTRCIQQDVPSVRLILTDHGLDRMFWKGKGAFILGCTSPFKAIMIEKLKKKLCTLHKGTKKEE